MDAPALIQASKVACEALESSIQKNGKSMDGLLELLNGTGAKLDALVQQGDQTIQTVDQSLTHLDTTLDNLMKALGEQMTSASNRVTSATAAVEDSVTTLKTASSNLSMQCSTTNDENRTHLENQTNEHFNLQENLGGLLTNLLDGSQATAAHANQTQDGIDTNHQQVMGAGATLITGFFSFGQALTQHGAAVSQQVSATTAQTQSQIDKLRADLDKQLQDASNKVKEALDHAASGANRNADQVEAFLAQLLNSLTAIQTTVDNNFRPPIKMIGTVEDKIQPIINLMGTLRDLGLV
ncbi:MAG: hypothetical protein U0931_28465 [Vulcanimicrobiota bacterium]